MAPLREVAARIQQHVGERTSHLAQGAQRAVVVAAVEHPPAAPGDPVQRTRQPCRDALHPACEGVLAVRLDDQVRVVALERVVVHAEVAALGRFREGPAPLPDEASVAKRREVRLHAQRNVHRAVHGHRPALAMQHARPRPARPAGAGTGAAATDAPSVVGERELLGSSRHRRR
jgi:hypothetical protein